MAGFSIDTSEVHAFAADLRHASERVEPLAELIVAKVGHDVAATAQQNAPVDTGFLKSSISVDVDGLSFEAGPSAEYGGYVEEGTSRMAPEPYLGPAFDLHLLKAEDALGQAGVKAIT